jgi:para-aminobenzoate synthetase component 1
MKQTLLEIPFLEPEHAFTAFAGVPGSVFLDSNDSKNKLSCYSFIAFEPLEIVETLAEIPGWFSSYKPIINSPLPFTGGAAGYISYDGDVKFGIYDQIIGFDLLKRRAWYCSSSDTQADAQLRWNSLKQRIDSAQPSDPTLSPVKWAALKSRTEFEHDIQTVIDYIHAGDIFQANLAQRFEAGFNQDPYAHYLKLRQINPAPFSAFLNFGSTIISSSSPERFLKVTDKKVETRPIKGTNADEEWLRQSAKDRAENIMIVDLLRNDLSQVCTDDSISVRQLCDIESYAGLHHLVSAVTGTLRPGQTALDALKACFPGGSITGAPKIRAMEIIAELEPFKRGPYCGAIGYIGFDGAMDMNIAIRTIVFEHGKAIYHAGGGVTAKSDPAKEYDETLLKAQKVFESFS